MDGHVDTHAHLDQNILINERYIYYTLELPKSVIIYYLIQQYDPKINALSAWIVA